MPGLDVKEEPPAIKGAAQVIEEIDLVTSDSETSTSGDDFVESELEDEQELEPASRDVLNEDYNDAWVQHKKDQDHPCHQGHGKPSVRLSLRQW